MKQILNLCNYNLNYVNHNILKERKINKILLNKQNDEQVRMIKQIYLNKPFILTFE